MTRVTSPQPPWHRCPYLGLHDDSSTSLAYASPWNYCYRSDPPRSVLVSYQSKVCLCRHYDDCAVYHSNGSRPLPRYLRARGRAAKLRTRTSTQVVRLIELFLLLTILMLVLLYAQRILP